jgi:hypothetical protein
MAIQRRISESPPRKQEQDNQQPSSGPVLIPPPDPMAGREAIREKIKNTLLDAARHDPERAGKLVDVEKQITTAMAEIQELAMQRYELDKKINRLSIKINCLERVKVRLQLPFYDNT